MFKQLKERLAEEVELNKVKPHAPVAGCCHIMPVEKDGWIELLVNGFAIRLFPSGEYEFYDYEKEAAVAETEKQP